jgi:peptide/nickel transport system permease protein
LSFLGLGVHLPVADWGSDLAAGAPYLATAWWLSTFPGLAITVTILLANFMGDYLAMVLDPRSGMRLKNSLRLAVPGMPSRIADPPAPAPSQLATAAASRSHGEELS